MGFRILWSFVFWVFVANTGVAAERALSLSIGDQKQRFTAAELFARSDTATLIVPNDVSYNREMTYRAVPLLGLIGSALKTVSVDTIEARATDGFVSHIPSALVLKGADGGAVAWIAVEDPQAPWPNLPNQKKSAGPFYLVWENPERSNVGREQWPYALASLSDAEDPIKRWPQLSVDEALPETSPEVRGRAAFITNCLPCHRLYGAGLGDIGPDLGKPMNVTQYMTEAGLRALIRDPKSVRTWPRQQMIGFDKATLSDADLSGLISYLTYLGKHKPAADAALPASAQ
ncbi:cytochrome C [Hyphomicrobium methylovorum]|uniref:cytochrome c n=1 Tax=Hyphomicrobium methylovorum TaxID=84 RepID=UPI0015E6A063|nr:cytochrome c [Hyphomicrobium methylovorum]MBA2127193.1 cytochrome C [Hyphomicrobium methylovorum]